MPSEALHTSRRLSALAKESRRLNRRAEQAAVNAQRAKIVAEMEKLTRSFAPSQQEAFSSVCTSRGGHSWIIKLCLGKGKSFDDIGRWFRRCTSELHFGFDCRKAKFVNGRLPWPQIWELKKLWALHDSVKNRVGKRKKYRYGRDSSPPIALMYPKDDNPVFQTRQSSCERQVPTCNPDPHKRLRPSSFSCPPKTRKAMEIPPTARHSTTRHGNSLRPRASRSSSIEDAVLSSEDEVPPFHVIFESLIQSTGRSCKSAQPDDPPLDVIEISSDSEAELFVARDKRKKSAAKGRNRRVKVGCKAELKIPEADIIEISSDSDEEMFEGREEGLE